MRSRREQPVEGARIGLFGLLGSGNIGNDASMEAILQYLQARHPSAVIDVMCSGPKRVTAEYGLDAVQMFWFDRHQDRLSSKPWSLLRVPSRIVDVFRVSGWVRRHQVVIVPGAGVLEASLPLRPWNTPYGLFLLTASGRLFRTKVALVCVGAGPIKKRATRTLSNWAARLAMYRSYRDSRSREAMRRRGLEDADSVFPDLAFSLPTPGEDRHGGGDWSTIGVGIMAYSGSNDDRDRAQDVYRAYVDDMKGIVCRLVDDDRKVRLFIGDTDGSDDATAREILTAVREQCPDLDETWVVAEPVTTFSEVMESMEPLGAIIATRFHNLVAALKLAKPTIAIGYSDKHRDLMADAGLAEFSHSVESFDLDVLVEQLHDMERRAEPLRRALCSHNAELAEVLDRQFDELDDVLFGLGVVRGADRAPAYAGTGGEVR
ncbi:MAG: polysaccharide pyruvyl transferase family protein [Acidimicrobiales bacterium]